MSNWVDDLETSIYAKLRKKLLTKFKTKYPILETSITTDDSTMVTKFPTVYFHVMSGFEKGQDLEGTSINAIMYTIQIDVSSKERETTREIMSEVVNIMKSMSFSVIALPEFNNQDDIKRQVVRVRRLIGANDLV